MKVGIWLCVLVCLVSSGAFVGGCSSPAQPSIVGKWKARTVPMPDDDYPQAMEIFENGTIVLQMEDRFVSSSYKLKGDNIVVEDGALTIAVLTKSTIVLTERDGSNTYVFDRAKK